MNTITITTATRTMTFAELLIIIAKQLGDTARSIKRIVRIYWTSRKAQIKATFTMQNFIHAIDCGDHDLDDLDAKTLAKLAAGALAFSLFGCIAL